MAMILVATSARAEPAPPYEEASSLSMAANGLLVGSVGFAAGMNVGLMLAGDPADDGDWDEVGYGLLGGTTVGALALGLGVHLANHDRGDVGPVVLGSLLVGVAGSLAAIGSGASELLLVTVPAQLVVAILAERSTARANHREATLEVMWWRPEGGGAGLALRSGF